VEIGPYQVGEEIGRGGMGIVLRARSASGDLALELLTTRDDLLLARFARERRMLERLGQAEGFVPILDAHPGGPFAHAVDAIRQGLDR
jgi:hypothetical protein